MRFTAFAEVMREKAGSVPHEGTVVEIVGTGGDEANTFNIFYYIWFYYFRSRHSCSKTW